MKNTRIIRILAGGDVFLGGDALSEKILHGPGLKDFLEKYFLWQKEYFGHSKISTLLI